MIAQNVTEYNTQHDWKPSHAPRPDWLVNAEVKFAAANKAYDDAIERYLDGTGNFKKLYRAMQKMQQAQQLLDDARYFFLNGQEPPSVRLARGEDAGGYYTGGVK
jgi:hypothetical protein